jgi:hypothetical protein
MTRWLVVGGAAASLLWVAGQARGGSEREPERTVAGVAREIRAEIGGIRQALAEVTPRQSNGEEICFRVGGLYLSARHELEEVAGGGKALAPRAKELVEELSKDARALPSFCGDKELVKSDPGYEQVPRGDLTALKRELANMDRRAGALLSP